MRISGIILAVDILSVPSFFFFKLPQAPSGLWVTLGGCCGGWAIQAYPHWGVSN